MQAAQHAAKGLQPLLHGWLLQVLKGFDSTIRREYHHHVLASDSAGADNGFGELNLLGYHEFGCFSSYRTP